MSNPPSLKPEEAIAKGIDALVQRRPSAADYVSTGRYGHVFAGWNAQLALLIERLVAEMRAGRLAFAEGEALRDLLDMEAPDPAYGIGTAVLVRTGTVHGVIAIGHPFVKRADPTAQPLPITEAQYTATAPVLVPAGLRTVSVPIQATATGTGPSTPVDALGAPPVIALGQPLFDSTFTVQSVAVAGGADDPSDRALRRLGMGLALGQYAPTEGAAIAGALSESGTVYLAARETGSGALALYPADGAWASSDAFRRAIAQRIANDWKGFGPRVFVRPVDNRFITVSASVKLRRAESLYDTSDIDESIRLALASYFDERPDWFCWSLSALRAVISRADRAILSCASVTVSDYATGAPIAQPTVAQNAPSLTHYYLPDGACDLEYSPP